MSANIEVYDMPNSILEDGNIWVLCGGIVDASTATAALENTVTTGIAPNGVAF